MSEHRRTIPFWVWGFVIAMLFSADRLFKWQSLSQWSARSITILPGIDLSFLLNKGIAFSVPMPTVVYLAFAIPILALCFFLLVREWMISQPRAIIAYGLLICGAVSNLLDRILYGGVIDYVSIAQRSVVNVADGMIVGAVLLLLLTPPTRKADIPKSPVS